MSGGIPRELRLELGKQRLCFSCKGRGGHDVRASGDKPDRWVECRRCKGAGLIDAATSRALGGDALPF